ncbi:cardiolipin synthase [Anaerotaenia torta]|uniref:cardiolipin synthase n=1 Tax=Anaerotaenia torta TaxID=433293 RepID=UPI003D207712
MWSIRLFGQEFYYIFYVFVIYGVVGWIYESILGSVKSKSFINRGFLTGPLIPIYGCGALLYYLVFWNSRDQYLLVFFGSMVLATVLEYVTSLVMELLFHARWWDYSDYPLNLNGRVCLPVSFFWGILALLMLHFIHPRMEQVIALLPRRTGEMAGYVILPVFVLDTTVSAVTSVKFDRILAGLQKLRQDMTEYIESSRLYETGSELREKLAGMHMPALFSEIRAGIEARMQNTRQTLSGARLTIQNVGKVRELIPEIEAKMAEFVRRYQNIRILPAHVRLLRAFPTMKVSKRESALSDLRDRLAKKGVREVSKDLKEEVTGTIKNNLSGILRAALVGLLVLAQFALIIYLSFELRGYTIYFYSLLQVLSMIIVVALVNGNRNASYKISWICIIAALPVTGHIMFLLWGNRRRKKIDKEILRRLRRGAENLECNPEVVKAFSEKYPTKSRMARYLESNTFPLYKNNKVDYYPMGEDVFEAIFDEIEKAEQFVLLNFFIIGEGALWSRLHELMLRKIKEGVRVMFLYDDFGAMLRTPTNFRRSLEAEGFEVRVFNPVHRYTDKLYLNYRSHQKIIVVDGNVGFTGGMNLADEYVNLVQRFGVWKDNAVRVEGDAVWGLTVTFLQMWEVSSSAGEPMDYSPYRPTRTFPENNVFCQVFSDGPANNPRNPVENIYKQMMYYAKKLLYITTPYLIIEDDMREALIMAASSGIDVRIITPFIPDKRNVKILTNYNYGKLLESGVRIFEYTPGFIHAKTIITEDCGIVGTVNMDYRSFHLHYECGVWICDRTTVDTIKEDLLGTMEQCREVSYEEWKNRPVTVKLQELFLNLFSTLM